MIGIRNAAIQAANLQVTNSVVPVDTDMTFQLAAGQKCFGKISGHVNVGATGGVRLLLHCSSAPSTYRAQFNITNDVTGVNVPLTQNSEADYTNALANAADHQFTVEFYIEANLACTVTLQFAQNTADPLTATFEKGNQLEVTKI